MESRSGERKVVQSMDPVIDTDVVVIGAGPIGLAAANLLADYGVRVLLVEKNLSTSDEPRAISVTDETLRVMQQIGIMDRLGPEMLMNTGARYFGRKGQLLAEVRPANSQLGHPGKSQFDQPVMESLLLDAARGRDSVEVRFETEAFSVKDHGTHVETTVLGPNGKATVRSAWLIACDGGRSPIRTQLGIAMEGSTQVEKWIVIDVINTNAREKFAEFYCNGVRPSVVVPGVKGRCRFEFMLLPGETAEQMTTPSSVAALVAPYLSQPVRPEDIRRASVYVAHQRVALQYQHGRILLAGDAAHMMPPFAGQGLNAGIRDAANLAWKVASSVHGAGTDELVSTYQTERRPHAADMVKLSHRIGQIVMSTDRKVTFLRDLIITAAGAVPSVQSWIASMKFLKRPRFTEGCIVPPATGLPTAVADIVGSALPQPTVRSSDGSAVPLDEVMGRGWCSLGFGGASSAIEVTPLGGAASSRVVVHDDTGIFKELVRDRYTVLVRPDRYVAAVVQAGREDEVFTTLDGLVPSLRPIWQSNHQAPLTASASNRK
nr:FAD-dependent monooxygenase [Rhodococcus sp. W8901]